MFLDKNLTEWKKPFLADHLEGDKEEEAAPAPAKGKGKAKLSKHTTMKGTAKVITALTASSLFTHLISFSAVLILLTLAEFLCSCHSLVPNYDLTYSFKKKPSATFVQNFYFPFFILFLPDFPQKGVYFFLWIIIFVPNYAQLSYQASTISSPVIVIYMCICFCCMWFVFPVCVCYV